MPGILQENISVMMPTMKQSFEQHNVAASQSAVALKFHDGTAVPAVTQCVMPFAALPTVITVSFTVAPAGANLTLIVTVNGTATAMQLVVVPGAPLVYYAVFEAGAPALNAGDKLGLTITTPVGWTATTTDLYAEVWFVCQDARF